MKQFINEALNNTWFVGLVTGIISSTIVTAITALISSYKKRKAEKKDHEQAGIIADRILRFMQIIAISGLITLGIAVLLLIFSYFIK